MISRCIYLMNDSRFINRVFRTQPFSEIQAPDDDGDEFS